MAKSFFAIVAGIALLITGGMQATIAADNPTQKTQPAARTSTANDNKLIQNAMTAAPKKVGAGATIVVAKPDGTLRTVREGNNGFTCMPDNPDTPGQDPMCMDAAALEWAKAWMARKTPPSGKVGFMYMLSGGTDASNIDPFASKPEPGNNWITTGPHLMIVGADPSFYNMYPKEAKPDTSAPFVMWPGSPYQHLMIPIR